MKEFPKIGLGTSDPLHGVKLPTVNNRSINKIIRVVYTIYYGCKQTNAVRIAINNGYRLIDTSSSYNNVKWIRLAIYLSKIHKKEMFYVSRVSNRSQLNRSVRDDFFKDLRRFDIEFFDLYQLHWPVTGYFVDAWNELIKLKAEGYIKCIGVANFNIHHLEELRKFGLSMPEVNQFEIHPLFNQQDLVEYCLSNKIIVQGYTPLGRQDEKLYKNNSLLKIATKYNKSISQIILKWHIQRNTCPIPRSMNKMRIVENISIFDFELTQHEMDIIFSINSNSRLRFDPDNCDFSKL